MPREDQGVFDDRYKIIPRTLIFVTCGTYILLLKGAPTKKLWANLYNGIGGHIEQGEDVISAAHRELREETNLDHIPLQLVGTIMVDTGKQTGIGIYVFHGEMDAMEELKSPEGTLEWVKIEHLNQLPLVEDLPALLALVFDKQKKGGQFAGFYRYDENDRLVVKFRSEED